MEVITDEALINKIWNKLYNEYGFNPSVNKENIPFSFQCPYKVFQLNKYWTNQQEEKINSIFKSLITEDKFMYALDWQHDCFIYSPYENILPNYSYFDSQRQVNVYFPSYYPNGDYHVFISEDWSFGMWGHPWREELYIWGSSLISEINKEIHYLDLQE